MRGRKGGRREVGRERYRKADGRGKKYMMLNLLFIYKIMFLDFRIFNLMLFNS